MEKLFTLGDLIESLKRKPSAIYEDIRLGLFPPPAHRAQCRALAGKRP